MSNETEFHRFENEKDMMQNMMQGQEILCAHKAELLLVHYVDGTTGFTINTKSPFKCIVEMTVCMIEQVEFEIEAEEKGSK